MSFARGNRIYSEIETEAAIRTLALRNSDLWAAEPGMGMGKGQGGSSGFEPDDGPVYGDPAHDPGPTDPPSGGNGSDGSNGNGSENEGTTPEDTP